MFWRRKREEEPAEAAPDEAPLEPDLDAPEPDPADFGADSIVAEPEAGPVAPSPAPPPAPGLPPAATTPAPPANAEPTLESLSPLARAAAFKPLFADSDEEIEEALEHGLERTRGGFMDRLRGALAAGPDGPSWDDVEETLIAGDVGAALAMDVVERARKRRDPGGAEAAVRAELAALLVQRDPHWTPRAGGPGQPAIVLIVGVNGTGKTTTIGKLATRYTHEGRKVLLAAADTFRAAAIDQLMIWADRASVPVVSHAPGADPGAVVYDSLDAAVARGMDLVIADTAGRLHTKANLMDELTKIRRIVDKRLPGAEPETLFVLDATTGQNGLQQAKAFHEAVGLTGIVLTKLDSTAKGGIVFAIEHDLGVPVRFVGVGEQATDLLPFDPEGFVQALFA
jgi:fused signal recognition particle receptor